jgi:ATP-dependent DNA helicase 2 subunit 1
MSYLIVKCFLFPHLRPGVVKAIEEFKASVFGENYDQEEAEAAAAKAGTSKKRKAITDAASQKSATYDWADLADNGKVSSQVILPKYQYHICTTNSLTCIYSWTN